MTPLVTIGIPTYNVGRFIALSIKSVLAQTYTNFELIITDDGSTDNTVDEISKFNDPRIKLIVDGKNHGISYRLNQQIDMAKGEYFVRMDGDDLMFPTRVEELVKYLQGHPDVDVVGTEIVVIDDNNEVLGCRRNNTETTNKRLLYKSAYFAHPTVAGRMDFFKRYHYKEEFDGVEDHNLWIRGYKGNNFARISKPLMFYRDPLVFKLKTYLSRMRILRKMYRCFIITDTINAWYLRKLLLGSYIKSILSFILSKLGLDSVMISRRNQYIPSDTYKDILNTIVKGTNGYR